MDLYLFTFNAQLSLHLVDILSDKWASPTLITDPSYLKNIKNEDDSAFFIVQDTNVDLLVGYIKEFSPRSIIFYLIPNAQTVAPANFPTPERSHDLSEWERLGIDFLIHEEDLTGERLSCLQKEASLKLELKNTKKKLDLMGENLKEWENLFFDSLDIMFIIDASSRKIIQANHTATILLGFTKEELIGMDFSLLTQNVKNPDDLDDAEFHGSAIINQGLLTIDKKWIPMESTWRLFQKDGVTHIIATFRDISERKTNEERIHRLAYYSTIVNMPNKIFFEEHLRHAISDARSKKEQFAVVHLDIDNFSLVNDSLGQEKGDDLLRLVGFRLQELKNSKIISAHLGGDEFGLLFRNIKNIEDIKSQVQDIQINLRLPYPLDERELYISFSFGIAIYPSHGDTSVHLNKSAEMAMYSAKALGKNTFNLYSEDMIQKVQMRLEIENDLRRAIQAKDFVVYFQPQVLVQTGELCGMEALVRWNHPEKGIVMPLEFITVAEDSGLIHDIGMQVLEKACQITKKWNDQGMLNFPVSVNFSGKQWNQLSVAKDIVDILDSTGLAKELLVIELTESSIMENPKWSIRTFKDLVEKGISLSVDDFGTGYSSLSYLKQLNVQHLKIDQSFINDLEANENDRAISTAIIQMAHSLGLYVVAEGVETPAQWRLLEKMGCDMIQGYLISRPISEKDFEEFVKTYRRLDYGDSIS